MAALALASIVAGCFPSPPDDRGFTGLWRSSGFGLLLDIGADDVVVYEYSSIHCLEIASTPRRGMADVASLAEGRLVLRDAGRQVRFEPVDELPAGCDDAPPGDAGSALAVAAATVEELYLPGVDEGWAQRRGELEHLAEAFDDDVGLFDLLVRLLAPLDDPQVTVVVPDGPVEGVWSYRVGDATLVEDGVAVPPGLAEPAVAGEGGIVTGRVGDDVGYIAFGRLAGFAPRPEESERVAAAALDRVLRGTSGIVVDLRGSSSGTVRTGLLLATRFVPAETVVADTRARDGSDAGPLIVRPLPSGTYDRPVVVLIGGDTAGAAEVVVLALRHLPFVTVVGEATAGSPAQPLVRSLPNGWSLSLPTLDVVTADGVSWAGRPIVPDILIADDRTQHHDPALEEAMSIVRSQAASEP
jgi:carboxyl-terminal processing protease